MITGWLGPGSVFFQRQGGKTEENKKGHKLEIWWEKIDYFAGTIFKIGHEKDFKFDGTIYTPVRGLIR